MKEELAKEIIGWISTLCDQIKYGEINVRVTLHDGQIKQIEKVISNKERLVV